LTFGLEAKSILLQVEDMVALLVPLLTLQNPSLEKQNTAGAGERKSGAVQPNIDVPQVHLFSQWRF
jgi:hypothetical protein